MERRTVQAFGPATLAVTLPAAWTSEYDVTKGDEVMLQGGSRGMLKVLSKAAQQPATEAIIHPEILDAAAVKRALIAQYVLGRRVIQVKTRKDDPLENTTITAVYDAEPQLMGLGVIEEAPGRITIRCSVNPDDFTLTDLLERLESTGRTMRDEAVRAFTHGTPDLAQRVLNRERQANKIFLLLLRFIVIAHRDPTQTDALGVDDEGALIGYRSTSKNLELTADNALTIAEFALDTENPGQNVDDTTLQHIQAFTEQVHEITEQGVQCVVAPEYEQALDVRRKFAQIEDRETEILTAIDELPNEDLLRVHEVLVHLRKTAEEAARNAEIGMNLTLTGESPYTTIS